MKKIIGFMIIIVMCIITIIAIVLLLDRKSKESYSQSIVTNVDDFVIDSDAIIKVSSKNEYIDISQCVKRYFGYIKESNADDLMELLDNDYLKMNNISKNNIYKYTYECKDRNFHYFIKEMKVKYNDDITQYIVNCVISGERGKENIFLIVLVDNLKNTFCILPVIDRYDNIDKVQLNNDPKSINENMNNKFIHNSINDEMICGFLLYDYINKAVYFSEEAYKALDGEYRDKRFSEFKDFQNYIKYNKNKLENSILDDIKQPSDFDSYEQYIQYFSNLDRVQLDKYLIQSDEKGKQYVCMDKNECCYVFCEKSPLNYTVILDTYTIPSEKFKNAYNNGNEQVKIQLNIDKFIKMINNRDYANAYNLLDDGFKNNYFKSEEKFENFIKNNFYEYNNVKFGKFSYEGEILIYEITISDKSNEATQKKLNIIMKLLDDYNFAMSFGNVKN